MSYGISCMNIHHFHSHHVMHDNNISIWSNDASPFSMLHFRLFQKCPNAHMLLMMIIMIMTMIVISIEENNSIYKCKLQFRILLFLCAHAHTRVRVKKYNCTSVSSVLTRIDSKFVVEIIMLTVIAMCFDYVFRAVVVRWQWPHSFWTRMPYRFDIILIINGKW